MKDFRSSADMLDAISEVVHRHVQGMRKEPASRLGLDERCGMLWVDEDTIVSYTGSRLDYYGGFEYIKEGEGRMVCGDYTFFTTESSRVQECFDYLNEVDEEEVE